MKGLLFVALCCFWLTSGFALEKEDAEAIAKTVNEMTDSWNDRAGEGFADYYTQDADFVNIFGMVFSGKREIEDRHLEILKTFLKGSIFEVVDLKMHEVKPDLVITHVYWRVSNIPKGGHLKEVLQGVFTHTFVKNEGAWEIAASQNTLIRS